MPTRLPGSPPESLRPRGRVATDAPDHTVLLPRRLQSGRPEPARASTHPRSPGRAHWTGPAQPVNVDGGVVVGRETFDAVYSKLWMTAFISAAGNMHAVRGDSSSSSTAFTARVQSIPGSARAIGRSVAADRTLAIGWPGGRQPGRASVSARILRVRAARGRARERRRDRHASRRPRSERRAADPLEGTRQRCRRAQIRR